MSWENILKRPVVDLPEPDRYFEYGPKWIEKTLKDWDKNNPAKVIHIEAPSMPDPADRMDDKSIRYAPSGSKKHLTHAFKFVTDRPIDRQSELFQKFRDKGYTMTSRKSDYIRRHYGEKINRITVPEEAVIYFIKPTGKVSEAQRRKYPKRDRIMPDRKRTTVSIEQWNEEKNKYNLGELEGFISRVDTLIDGLVSVTTPEKEWGFDNDIKKKHIEMLGKAYNKTLRNFNLPVRRIVSAAKLMMKGDFARNKHDLYLSQQLPLNTNWVKQNITRPAYNQEIKKETSRIQSEYEMEQRRKEAAENRRNKALDEMRQRAEEAKAKRAEQAKSKREQRPQNRGATPRTRGIGSKATPYTPQRRRKKKQYRAIGPYRKPRKPKEDTERMDVSKSWRTILKALRFNSIAEIHGHIDEMEDMLYDLMMADRYVLYMEDLSKDLHYIRQEKDLQAATEMFNGLQNEINRLYDDYNKSTGMLYDI